ncbi:MAG: hypothetical protein WA843_02935 [Candidatus Saccharimonadales bacterium]
MSITQYPAEIPISTSNALDLLFDHVDLRPAKLEAVLPALDLDFDGLSSTHIHLGHQELLSRSERMTHGQCLKVFLGPSGVEEGEEEKARAKYVDYLIPGFPEEKISGTTFVTLDLLSITIETFLREHGLVESDPPAAKKSEPDMFDLEQAICHNASKILMHELLHVPKPMKAGISADEHDPHRENEESFVESKLAEIGEEGVPTRLVSVRLAHGFTMESLAIALQAIQDHRNRAQSS